MTKHEIREANEEFATATFDVGVSYGIQGKEKNQSIVMVQYLLNRTLTTAEYVAFTNGWLAGWNDFVARTKEQNTAYDNSIYPAPDFSEISL